MSVPRSRRGSCEPRRRCSRRRRPARVQRQRVERAPHREEVPVRVDEARQQGPLAQLDDARGLAAQGQHVLARAGRGYRLAPHRHRLDRRLRRVHRDDPVAEEQDVRRRAVVTAGWARDLASCQTGAGRADEENEGPFDPLHEVAPFFLPAVRDCRAPALRMPCSAAFPPSLPHGRLQLFHRSFSSKNASTVLCRAAPTAGRHLFHRSFSSKNASTRCSYCSGKISDTRSWRALGTIHRS